MRKILLLPLLLVLTGCSFAVSVQDTPTPTAVPFFTATLLASVTPYPSATYAPPTITPTIEPLEALTNAQVNVRSGPAQANASLGLIDFGTKVQLIGKNTDGTWYRIVYKDAAEGMGWVTANFITFGGDVDKIPVVDAAAPAAVTPPDGTPATAAPSPTAKGKTSSVTAKINVRAGPATSFDSLGMIEADTTVTLTGRNEINNWVQIQFADAPDGKGWVAALYLKDPDLRGLPVYGNDGKLISGSTPQPNPGEPTPTPTGYAPAAADNDSASNPGVRQTLSTDGAGVLIYSSELSSPDGDNTDWVAFTLDGPASQSSYLYFRLDCVGNNAILVTLQKDGHPVADAKTLQCGNYDLAMKVLDGQEYMLVLRADTAGTLRFVSYKLTIKASR